MMNCQLKSEALPPITAYPHVALDLPAGAEGWPVTFQSIDPCADGGVRLVELHRDHLVLRRRMAGIPMRLRIDMAAYEGLAVALLDPDGEGEGVAVVLLHPDPALSVTLYSAPHIDDVVAEWRRWSAELGRPMLVTEADGSRSPAYPMLGRLTVAGVLARRRRRGALKDRRPSVFRRRAAGRPLARCAGGPDVSGT
ncbi:DUF6101 family protein [Ancylobacter sp. MQZ15Z-1]|uniref:DUF6101 family protein n=1 Tax=Ancylobacter mangrovi TaxID=2972472 RepID=A0A9X2T1D4_9HYPH|nr:DUF6101 family protein [Ancylobacter mangrovi]MCS0494900.1 DUF6101 family protein [Ancylobacter mangrovi]